jgi:hypothetical protein
MKIENYNMLTLEQKKLAEKQLKIIEENIIQENINFFKNNGYLKLEKVIDNDMCLFFYEYTKLEAQRLNYLELNNANRELSDAEKGVFGKFDDPQAIGDFSKYGDLTFDTLMILLQEKIEKNVGLKLHSNYSYHRLYTRDTELKRHKDRPSCEISTTLCLGLDRSNISYDESPEWNWPMYVKGKNNNEIPIGMNPGDMIIYRGCDIEHWREPLKALNNAQVFLHYNEVGGQFNIQKDGRPTFGLSKNYDGNIKI